MMKPTRLVIVEHWLRHFVGEALSCRVLAADERRRLEDQSPLLRTRTGCHPEMASSVNSFACAEAPGYLALNRATLTDQLRAHWPRRPFAQNPLWLKELEDCSTVLRL